MTARKVIQWPDQRLRRVAAPVDSVTNETRAIWDEMIAVVKAMRGAGLAAPQIGILKRLIIIDGSDAGDSPLRMANPEIVRQSERNRDFEEGSPCLPGAWAMITRPRAVTARYLNETGESVEREFLGLWATSLQHQVDHLDGKMFFDRLTPLKRKMLMARARKHARASKSGS